MTALVDWELAALGDPLLDVGSLLATWPLTAGNATVNVAAPHLPTPDQVVQHYAQRTGRDPNDIHWYQVLACFRLAIVLEGTNARASAGKATVEIGHRLHRLATGLIAQANRLVSGA